MIGSLLFVVWFLMLFACLVAMIVNLLRKRRSAAVRNAQALAAILVGYLFDLVSVAVLNPRRIIPQGNTWRFDHWGVAVESVEALAETGKETNTRRVAVTLRVSNDAKRVPQRAADAQVLVTDGSWQRFDVSIYGATSLRGDARRLAWTADDRKRKQPVSQADVHSFVCTGVSPTFRVSVVY